MRVAATVAALQFEDRFILCVSGWVTQNNVKID